MASSVGVKFDEHATYNHQSLCGGARIIGKSFTRDNYSGRIGEECAWYIPGMLGHAFHAVGKILELVRTLLGTLVASFKSLYSLGRNPEYNESTKQHWMLTLDTVLVLGIDVIGIVVPPLAYRLDDYVVENFVKKFLFPDMINRYQNPRLGVVDPDAATAQDYEVLGLSQGATKAEVRAAYRELAKQYHPDKNKSEDTTAKFQEIKLAYDKILKDSNLA